MNTEHQENTDVADVLVVGGGPAGSATAALLARGGRRVLLLDKDRHPRFHIGESLLPMSMPLLKELGILAKVEAIGVVKQAADFPSPHPDGYQAFRFSRSLNPTWPHAVQVLRSEFDALLLGHAEDEGACVRQDTEVTLLRFEDRGVVAECRSGDGSLSRARARYLVDATGRDTLLGRTLGLKQRNRSHQSAALYAHFRGVARRAGEDAGNTSIYRVEDGWIWVIPLRDDVTSIGLVCGPGTLRRRGRDSARFLWEVLRSVPQLSDRVAEAEMLGQPEATGNYSYQCRRIAGKRWIMVGDAGGFVDPIFSSGVHLALHSAFGAARVVDAALDDPALERQLRRTYSREQRRGLRRVAWFIYRFNTPVMRRLFANPRNDWRMEEAIIGMLAGDFYRDDGMNWRLRIFKAIYLLGCLFDLPAAWHGFSRGWQRQREVFVSDPANTP